MQLILIILYLIVLIILYIFIYKRLKHINDGHIDHIGCKHLKTRNNIILFFIAILLIVLFILSTISFITLI